MLADFQPSLDFGEALAGPAQLTNLGLALRTMQTCSEAGADLPRLGLFYGFSGYGKTMAASFVAARTGAIYVAARSVWQRKDILEAIAFELGIAHIAKTASGILQQIIDQLNFTPTPIIIDEMDHLVQRKSVEVIRDILDATRVGIMLIGEESLPAKLKEWDRFDNRILIATAAQPSSFDDAIKLRDRACRRVQIADDLVEVIRLATRGVTRYIASNLHHIQEVALAEGVTAVDRAWWGSRPLRTGEIAVRRQEAA